MSSPGLLLPVASISVEGITDLIHIRIWKYISLAFLGEEKKKSTVILYIIFATID